MSVAGNEIFQDAISQLTPPEIGLMLQRSSATQSLGFLTFTSSEGR
jgi:hypothetical protein